MRMPSELTGALDSPIGGYSHGMKQKLAGHFGAYPRAAAADFDEPFVGLDPQAAFVLKGFLREICAAGGAVFFSTHVLEVAEKLCDRIAIIKGGRLVKMGTTASVVEMRVWNRCSWSWRRRAVHMRKLWVLLKLNFRAMLRAFSFRSGAEQKEGRGRPGRAAADGLFGAVPFRRVQLFAGLHAGGGGHRGDGAAFDGAGWPA